MEYWITVLHIIGALVGVMGICFLVSLIVIVPIYVGETIIDKTGDTEKGFRVALASIFVIVIIYILILAWFMTYG